MSTNTTVDYTSIAGSFFKFLSDNKDLALGILLIGGALALKWLGVDIMNYDVATFIISIGVISTLSAIKSSITSIKNDYNKISEYVDDIKDRMEDVKAMKEVLSDMEKKVNSHDRDISDILKSVTKINNGNSNNLKNSGLPVDTVKGLVEQRANLILADIAQVISPYLNVEKLNEEQIINIKYEFDVVKDNFVDSYSYLYHSYNIKLTSIKKTAIDKLYDKCCDAIIKVFNKVSGPDVRWNKISEIQKDLILGIKEIV